LSGFDSLASYLAAREARKGPGARWAATRTATPRRPSRVRTALSWAWTAVPPTPSASACRPQCRRRSRPPPSPCSPVPLPAAPTATPSEVIAKGSSRSEGVWCVPRVKNRILRNRPRVFVSNFGDFVSVNATNVACSRFIGHI